MNNRQMLALVSYNHGGQQAQIQFGPLKQRKNQQYDGRVVGQQPFIPRLYPTIPNYQPPFYPKQGFPPTGYNQFGPSTMSTDLISLKQSNRHYQRAQLIRHIDGIQKNYWKQHSNTMPVARRADSSPAYNRPDKLYQYEKDTRYLPYPVFGQGVSSFGINRNLGYGYPPNAGFIGGFNSATVNVGDVGNLSPKLPVIFMPQGSPSLQQPYSQALAMPPFTFNRMSQPLCSLPLPPPLPDIGSLCLSPLVQQMVIRQYANPVAVLPFTPNWPTSRSMAPSCFQIPQQQPPFIMPPLILPSSQSIPQPCIPSTSLPASLPVFSVNAPSYPFTFDANSAGSQYFHNTFPSICRACIPPPPPLNVPVASHFWTQHCSACHHVFADANKPNIRPNNGRSTPLLRHPTVIQNAYNAPMQKQLYPHTNASFAIRPWAHKLPSLPQGAVIISDQYFPIPRINSAKKYNFSQKYAAQHPPTFTSASRSISLATTNTTPNKSNTSRLVTRSQKKYQDEKSQSRSKSISITPSFYSNVSNRRRSSSSFSSSSSSSSVSSSCSVCNALAANEKPKSDLNAHNSQQNLARKQLSAAARNINLRYNYRIPDLPTVYHNNRYLKSSDTDSTSLSNSGSSPNIFIAKQYKNDRPPSPVYLNAIQEEDEEEKRTIHSLSVTSFQTSQPVTKKIIIKKMTATSPSTVSTISVDSSLDLTENDIDSISMTETIQGDSTEEETEEETEDINERL